MPIPPAILAAVDTAAAPPTAPAVPRVPGAYLRAVPLAPDAFGPFGELKGRFGFVPALFRAQTLKPGALEAEVEALRDILLTEDVLSRRQKELVLLVVSASNLDTYGVALHTELLRGLGVPPEASDRVVVRPSERGPFGGRQVPSRFRLEDHRRSAGLRRIRRAALRAAGFSDRPDPRGDRRDLARRLPEHARGGT